MISRFTMLKLGLGRVALMQARAMALHFAQRWRAALVAHVWAELMIATLTSRFTMRKLVQQASALLLQFVLLWQHPQIGHSNCTAQSGAPSQSGYFDPLVDKGPSFCVYSHMCPDIVCAITFSTISRYYVLHSGPAACGLQQTCAARRAAT